MNGSKQEVMDSVSKINCTKNRMQFAERKNRLLGRSQLDVLAKAKRLEAQGIDYLS